MMASPPREEVVAVGNVKAKQADGASSGGERKPWRLLEHALNCPRCDSTNTKFCYYNNYSMAQPRYLCKTCRRYWTQGGVLRNVPVGGSCRKNKQQRAASASSSSSDSSKKIRNNNNTPQLMMTSDFPNVLPTLISSNPLLAGTTFFMDVLRGGGVDGNSAPSFGFGVHGGHGGVLIGGSSTSSQQEHLLGLLPAGGGGRAHQWPPTARGEAGDDGNNNHHNWQGGGGGGGGLINDNSSNSLV
ncbi:hypothetical protein HU200_050098 [Digitaria exilis]|uniref:Dof zinc finger protein n=1 Tax=Digitaria exilis TaxID=1010633 RepID=A0A835AVB7_9POAL|nr:hypothetical protein HU200_050098 [Digitaria exilis]CAB3488804.1 unnamed protein product [Digitaria exilis]